MSTTLSDKGDRQDGIDGGAEQGLEHISDLVDLLSSPGMVELQHVDVFIRFHSVFFNSGGLRRNIPDPVKLAEWRVGVRDRLDLSFGSLRKISPERSISVQSGWNQG
jgi:hypothetical protein